MLISLPLPMTWTWLEAVLLLCLASTSSERSIDLTLQRDSMGADVVRSVQSKLDDTNVFDAPSDLTERQAYELYLRESAYVESKDGTQYPLGVPDGGIWRMSREVFEQTQVYDYPQLFNAICEAFCIDWSSVNYDELRSPLYSGLATSIFLHHLYITNRTLLETSTDMDKAVFWVTQFGESRLAAQWISRVEQLRIVEVCRVDTDAVFVLDSSASIGPTNYQIVRDYAHNFTENLLSGNSNSRVGVILFSDSASVEIELNNTREPLEILQGIRNLPYRERYTNTPEGLCLLESMPWRSSVSVLRIAIVLTDGMSNRGSVYCAQENGMLGTVNATAARVHSLQPPVTVLAVGIAGYVAEELLVIATNPLLIDELDSFDYRLLLQNQRSRGYFICFKEQQPISVGREENGAIAMNTITRLEFSGPAEDGVTVKICIDRGTIVVYGSYTTPNPNSALYDFSDIMTAADGEVAPSNCSVHYVNIDDIDPNLPDCNQCNTVRRKRRQSESEQAMMVRIYISIEGAATESLFTVNSSNGNAFECADGFCGANGEVVRRGVSCSCECIRGYELIGLECLNIDECAATPGVCGANTACLDTNGSYECYCEPGYRTSSDHLCIESQEDFFKVGIYVVAAGALFAVVMVLAVIGVLLCRYKDTREWKH